jgi:hypothetical protein
VNDRVSGNAPHTHAFPGAADQPVGRPGQHGGSIVTGLAAEGRGDIPGREPFHSDNVVQSHSRPPPRVWMTNSGLFEWSSSGHAILTLSHP